MLRRALIFAAVAVGASVLISAGFIMNALFEINAEIDRCLDHTSGRYISNPDERAAVCDSD